MRAVIIQIDKMIKAYKETAEEYNGVGYVYGARKLMEYIDQLEKIKQLITTETEWKVRQLQKIQGRSGSQDFRMALDYAIRAFKGEEVK